jgi:hypothetical protein
MLSFALFLSYVAAAQCAIASGSPSGNIQYSEQDKLQLIQDLQDQELQKEIENMISGLDEDQLDKLEQIMAKNLDSATEFQMLEDELLEMGMDEEDVQDLLDLGKMMFQFLERVPGLAEKMSADEDGFSLEDNVRMYLLGLPNKLGPLGFVALHSVLEAPEDIVDVKIGSFVSESSAPSSAEQAPRYTSTVDSAAVAPVGDLIARKKAAMDAAKIAASATQQEQDLVDSIISRRRRALMSGF